MGNSVQALRALQEIDKDLFRVNTELERLPEELARRQATLDNVKVVLEDKRKGIMESQVKVRELADGVETQQQRIRKLEKETMNNPDVSVVEACRYEIRNLKRQIDEAEREQLIHMESIERAKIEIQKIEERLEAELEVFDQFSQNVESELSVAKSKQEDLQGKREARMSSELDPQTLELYERLLVARDGEALAMLDGGVCQSCYMQVPPNLTIQLARGDRIIQCSSCDRIMYLP